MCDICVFVWFKLVSLSKMYYSLICFQQIVNRVMEYISGTPFSYPPTVLCFTMTYVPEATPPWGGNYTSRTSRYEINRLLVTLLDINIVEFTNMLLFRFWRPCSIFTLDQGALFIVISSLRMFFFQLVDHFLRLALWLCELDWGK